MGNFNPWQILGWITLLPNHKPTRGKNFLDLIFTNHPQLVKSTHVTPGIYDHDHDDIVVLDSDLKAQGKKK